jgi:TPR repeat protein
MNDDDKKSFKYIYRKAIEGDINAQYELGYLYYSDSHNNHDFKTAHYWLEKVAKRNHIRGIYMLSLCYIYGIGVKKDSKQAIYW